MPAPITATSITSMYWSNAANCAELRPVQPRTRRSRHRHRRGWRHPNWQPRVQEALYASEKVPLHLGFDPVMRLTWVADVLEVAVVLHQLAHELLGARRWCVVIRRSMGHQDRPLEPVDMPARASFVDQHRLRVRWAEADADVRPVATAHVAPIENAGHKDACSEMTRLADHGLESEVSAIAVAKNCDCGGLNVGQRAE